MGRVRKLFVRTTSYVRGTLSEGGACPPTLTLQLRQEKVQLEQSLEQEQEALVNKLMRKIERLEAQTLAKQSNLEQLRREKVFPPLFSPEGLKCGRHLARGGPALANST